MHGGPIVKEWKEEIIKELQAAVAPTKLTVAVESVPLEDQLAALNSTELKILRIRTASWVFS